MQESFPDEGIYEVEDLVEHKTVGGKDYFLVKWKGYGETSWEPDENIGDELAQLKAAAKGGAVDAGVNGKRKREKKVKKEKKEKKKRRRESSEDRGRKRESDSESSKEEDGQPPPNAAQGMVPGMVPGMPPGMPPMMMGMPMPGMPPHMPMGPGMMPGMLDPMKGMGKGFPAGPPGMPPMMMKGGGGKAPPPMMGKGGPQGCQGCPPPGGPMGPQCKGKTKGGKPMGQMGPGYRSFEMGMQNREALDMQRFAVERKRRLREFAGSLHLASTSGDHKMDEESANKTQSFMDAVGLQLEGHQLPVLTPTEVLVADTLWQIWLRDPERAEAEKDEDLLMNIARLARVNQTRTRQLFIRAFQEVWPTATRTPSARALQLFNILAGILPKPQHMYPPGSPEYWRDLVTQIDPKLDVEALLAKYRGRERTLYLGLCEKYKVPPTFGAMPQQMPFPGAASGMPGATPGMPGPGPPPADAAPVAAGDGSSPPAGTPEYVARIRELICELYKEHNPDKLEGVSQLMEKYKGREEMLYTTICSKYNVKPKLGSEDGAKDQDKAEEKKTSVEKYKQLISEIYAEHNKEKLGELDEIFKKYQGKEKTLYLAVCKKYNIEPKKKKKDEEGEGGNEEEKAEPAAPPEKAETTAPPENTEPTAPPEKAEPPAPQVLGNAAEVRKAYADLIREVYTEHNPDKLASVDQLLGKYLGQEQELYLTICRKYSVTPKDPLGLGSLDWITEAEERLPRILERLASLLVLHNSGLRVEDAKRLSNWQSVRLEPPPRRLGHRIELDALQSSPLGSLVQEVHGEEGARWQKLKERCLGIDIKSPHLHGGGANRMFTVDGDSCGPKGRAPFDEAVTNFMDAITYAIRKASLDDEIVRHEKWLLPWCAEEALYITDAPSEEGGEPKSEEIGITYKRGLWNAKKKNLPLHAHAAHYNLIGPDVEARLPEIWRQLADKLCISVKGLAWGDDVPVQAVVTVEAMGGNKARAPNAVMPLGCTASKPSVSVVVTSVIEEELESAKAAIAPLLQRVLSEFHINGHFVQSSVFMPQHKRFIPRPVKPRGGDSSSSGDDMDDGEESEEVMSDAEPTESYRPLRLTRSQIRDAYLQGLLCLNCDAADHKHQDCPYRTKVCWNCHGQHAGNDCPMRCRFCKERHDYPILECVKRVCRRVNDWKKSPAAKEQREVISSFEQLMIKLEGFEDLDLAKHNVEVQNLVKGLNEKSFLFPGDSLGEIAAAILKMKPPPKKEVEQSIPPPPPGPPPKPYVAPKQPKDTPPPMPENKYPWVEKVFLDTMLPKGMYGSNVLSRIIGRGGMHHRRMESESGARVFFRGLGVSGRDMELNEPSDCRLHIAVKGDVPAQGQTVRRIVKELITELDNEIQEKMEAGPLLDKPRDVDAHPFGFLLAKGNINSEHAEPLKFKFPEEDGQTLNDLLVWLKQAKLPLDLDSDTQWRTTLQITPTEPAPMDDAPPEAEAVVEAFNRMLAEWHYPCPYWFEEQDLRPTGLWSTLAAEGDDGDLGDDACPIILQQGQGVRLSAVAVAHYATLLEQSGLSGVPRAVAIDVLARLRGCVRRAAQDEHLLLYLAYPWAFFAESMGRGLKLPFSREQVHNMLVELGRVGAKPTESNAAPAFRGFIVEWLPLKSGPPREGAEQLPAPSQAAMVQPPAPQTSPPQPWPGQAAPNPAAPSAAATATPKGVCKYWLPEAVFGSTQDLKELLAGPGGAHFGHLLKKFPAVQIYMDGQPSMSVPPAHRLHVCMSSEDYDVFEPAAADVLDLVETVCDMVGEELALSEDQVESLIKNVRTEKYFEAHGIRTPLASGMRPAAPPPPAASTVPAPLPVAPAPMPPKADDDFEFVDDDVEMDQPAGADGDATEDEDARTQASDELSEISDDGGAPPQQSSGQFKFDDI